VIADEGPGFDTRSIPDPTDPENFLRPSGRGLLLIRTFMQETYHNEAGNEITLVKRGREPSISRSAQSGACDEGNAVDVTDSLRPADWNCEMAST
jgi:hypothetical protein